MSEKILVGDEEDGGKPPVEDDLVDVVIVEDDEPKKEPARAEAPEEDDDDADATLKTAEIEDGEISEEEREKRKRDRALKRDRRRAAEAASKREIENLRATTADLAKRLATYEKRNIAADMEKLDAQIAATRNYIDRCNAAFGEAVAAQDKEAIAKINEAIYSARQNLGTYESLKQRFTAEASAPKAEGLPNGGDAPAPKINPVVRDKAAAWVKAKASWYNPMATDRDSKVLLALSESLADDGYDPADDEHWEKLTEEAAKFLPHRFTPPKPATATSRPSGGGGGTGRGSGGGSDAQLRLPKQLVSDWKEAGIWDDPARRKKALTEYKRINSELTSSGKAA